MATRWWRAGASGWRCRWRPRWACCPSSATCSNRCSSGARAAGFQRAAARPWRRLRPYRRHPAGRAVRANFVWSVVLTVFQRVVVLGSTGSIGSLRSMAITRHPERLAVYAVGVHAHAEAGRAGAGQPRGSGGSARRCGAPAVPGRAWPAGPACPKIGWAPRRWRIRPPTRVATRSWPPSSARPACRRRWPRGAGKRVLLANKEALVAAGSLFMQAIRDSGADAAHRQRAQRHFQCLPHGGRAQAPDAPAPGVRRLLLTASGGPFRGRDLDDLHDVTPAQACAHRTGAWAARFPSIRPPC